MKLLKLSVFVLLATFLSLTACNDKESAPSYEFSSGEEAVAFGVEGGSLAVSVSVGDSWSVTCPDWVSVSPDSGDAGEFVLTVSAEANRSGSDFGIPRYGVITIREASGGEITFSVSQDGYWEATLENLADFSEGTNIYLLSPLTVLEVFPSGFMAVGVVAHESGDDEDGDDGQEGEEPEPGPSSVSYSSVNIWVLGSLDVNVGDELTVYGKRFSVSSLLCIVADSCSLLSSGNEVGGTEPTDITDVVDSYEFSPWEYVKITGYVSADGDEIYFLDYGTTFKVVDVAKDVDFKPSGYATFTGYCGGTSSAGIDFYVTEEDFSYAVMDKVLYYNDFEWLKAWFDNGVTNDTVATNASAKNSDGQTVYDYFSGNLGHRCFANKSGTKTEGTDANGGWYLYNDRTYYLRWGQASGKAYVVAPEFTIPSTEAYVFRLTFDVYSGYSTSFTTNDSYDEDRPDIRFEFLDTELSSTPYASYYWEGHERVDTGEIEKNTWYSVTWDLLEEDLAGKTVCLGYGCGAMDAGSNANRITAHSRLDNIKLRWIGAPEE